MGTFRGAKDLDILHGKSIEVNTKGWRTAPAIDGEIVDDFDMPLKCVTRAGVLRVLVPPHSKAS
jgi:hypothetical protein